MSDIPTRVASLNDLDAIAPLFDAYRQFYEQAPDLALARRFIAERLQNGESVVLLALDTAGQAIGFCQLYPSFCSVNGAVRMDLRTAKTNQVAQSVYEAAGWIHGEMFHDYSKVPGTAPEV